MQIPSGFATSRFGVRRIFPGAMLLTSVFTALTGTTSSLLQMQFFRFGLGIAEGPLPIGITTTINNWFSPKEKGTVSGIFLAAVKFGPVIVPPICAVIVSIRGWREIFYFFAIPGIALAVIWYLLVKEAPDQSRFVSRSELDHIRQASTQGKPVKSSAPRRSFKWLDRLIRAEKVQPLTTKASVFRSWDNIGCALGYSFQLGISNILLGARRKPGMLISALLTAGMMYLLINSPEDPTLYGLLLFATGVVLSLGFSAYMAFPMTLASKSTFPIASAVVNTGGQIGGACAPIIAGFLLDSVGWSSVFAFMAAGSLMSFLFVSTIREPLAD